MSVDMFAYGILMYPDLLRALTGRCFVTEPAVLPDFQRYSLVKNGWPKIAVIVPEPGASVSGVLLRDMDARSAGLLDDFEEIDIGLYTRCKVTVEIENDRACPADSYVAGPETVGFLGEIWDPVEFCERHYHQYRDRIIPQFLAYKASR